MKIRVWSDFPAKINKGAMIVRWHNDISYVDFIWLDDKNILNVYPLDGVFGFPSGSVNKNDIEYVANYVLAVVFSRLRRLKRRVDVISHFIWNVLYAFEDGNALYYLLPGKFHAYVVEGVVAFWEQKLRTGNNLIIAYENEQQSFSSPIMGGRGYLTAMTPDEIINIPREMVFNTPSYKFVFHFPEKIIASYVKSTRKCTISAIIEPAPKIIRVAEIIKHELSKVSHIQAWAQTGKSFYKIADAIRKI